MAVLEGMDKILNIVNKFLEQFNATAYWNEDFEARCESREIGFTLAVSEDSLLEFTNDAYSRYVGIEADPFLWLFLHELGHVMTDNEWTEEELEYFEYQKEMLTEIEDDQLRADWYHAIPDEFMATRWAAEFMMDYPEVVADFWDELQSAIMEFYFIHNLSNDEDDEDLDEEAAIICTTEFGTTWYRK